MQTFIEITVFETNRKMLIRTAEIKFVDELESGAAQITTEIKEKLSRVYINTKESYAEIKALLQEVKA